MHALDPYRLWQRRQAKPPSGNMNPLRLGASSRLVTQNKVQVVAYFPTVDVFHLNAISFLISVAKKNCDDLQSSGLHPARLTNLAFLALSRCVALACPFIAYGSYYYKPCSMHASATSFCI